MYNFGESIGVIFGATGLLGSNLAFKLSDLGSKLILHGRSIKKLKNLDDKIKKKKIRQILLEGDLNNKKFYENLQKTIYSRFDRIDFIFILVANFDRLTPLTHLKHNEWNKLIDTNINSTWRILKELDPLLKKSKNPKLIFLDNKEISEGKAFYNALSVSKAAIKTLAKVYHTENRNLNIATKIFDLPNLRRGVTSPITGIKEKEYNVEDIVKKIIHESFVKNNSSLTIKI